jgi:hypothetical protein
MLSAVLLVCVMSVLPVANARAAQSRVDSASEQPGQVTVQGTARVYRKPDYVDVFIAVQSIAATASEAQKDCSTKMEAVLAAVKELKLEGLDLKTGDVELSPRYDHRTVHHDDVAPKIIGYFASNSVRVRTSDLKAVPKTIDAAIKHGSNRIEGVTFGIKEVLEAREEALRMATRAAKRKATVMAESLDAALGKVVSANEYSHSSGGWSNRSGGIAQMQMSNESAPISGEEAIEPGQIEILVTVTLTYTLKE